MTSPAETPADVLVIFGITGDLAKKMTFRSLYRLERRKLLDCPIVGVAFDDWSVAALRDHARQAIEAAVKRSTRMYSRDSPSGYRWSRAILPTRKPMSGWPRPSRARTRPCSTSRSRRHCSAASSRAWRTPTLRRAPGSSWKSRSATTSRRPARSTTSCAACWRSGRSFASTTFSVRNRRWTSCSCGSPTRSSSRCGTGTGSSACRSPWPRTSVSRTGAPSTIPSGALRDVVQNHLLQLIGLFAAEPPSVADADGLRDKRAEVFRAMPSADPAHYVRGQYDGYRSVKGVQPDSQTETFAALRLEIDNWRWSGVPFFLRAGKALPVRATEIRVIFKRPPKLAITTFTPDANELVLRIDPSPGTDLVDPSQGARSQPHPHGGPVADLRRGTR